MRHEPGRTATGAGADIDDRGSRSKSSCAANIGAPVRTHSEPGAWRQRRFRLHACSVCARAHAVSDERLGRVERLPIEGNLAIRPLVRPITTALTQRRPVRISSRRIGQFMLGGRHGHVINRFAGLVAPPGRRSDCYAGKKCKYVARSLV